MLDMVEAEIREKNLHPKKMRSLQSNFSHHCLLGLILQVRPGMGFWVQIPGVSHPRRRWKPPATLPRTHRRPPSERSCFPCLKLAGVKAEFPSELPSPGPAHGLFSPPHHRWSTLQ